MADELYPDSMLETQDQEAPQEPSGLSREELRELLAQDRKANAELVAQTLRRAEPGVPLQRDNIIPEINFSLEGLPDPAMDVRAFHTEYMKRFNQEASKAVGAVTQRARLEAQQVVSDERAKNKLEGIIREHIPGISDKVMGVAAGVIAGQYRQQGKDPMAELRARPEEIAQEIVDYIDDLASETGRAPRAEKPREPADRSGGLVSPRGRTTSPRQAQRPSNDTPDPNQMFRDLTAQQSKARIY